MRTKMKLAALAAGATMLAAGTADATITVYTSQAAFLAALSTQGEDTFEELKNAEVGVSAHLSAGAFSYTASSTVASPGNSFLVRAGSKTERTLMTDLGSDSILFTGFSSGVDAIGGNFFTSGTNGLATTRPLGLFLYLQGGGGDDDYDYEYIPSATATSFLGFISTTGITELQVEEHSYASDPKGYPTVNNLYLGTAKIVSSAPEPTAWALMLVGFGGAGALLRQRRRAATA